MRVPLIRSRDNRTVWSATYTCSEGSDVAETASAIGKSVRLHLARDRQCESARQRARNAEAAELACAAIDMNYRINQAGHLDPSLVRANAERAIELDGNLLEAYQMLPTAYYFQTVYGELAAENASQLAHRAIDRALSLDPEDAYTLYTRSLVQALLDCDYDSAEQNAHRAIARDPLHPNARWFHANLAMIERRRGNLAAALEHYRRAIDIYDSDGRIQAEYAETLFFAGESRDAIATARTARQLTPYAVSAFFVARSEVQSLVALGQLDQAREVVDWYLGHVDTRWKPYAAAFDPAAHRDPASLRSVSEHPNPLSYPSILTHLRFEEIDLALRELRRGIEVLDPIMAARIRVDPAFRVLGDDPRWIDCLRSLEEKEAERRARHRALPSA